MAFKIQDLLISDPSTKGLVVYCTKTTGATGHLCGTTPLLVAGVGLLALFACTHFLGRKPEDSAEQIALLKAQLKEALEELELEEASGEEHFKAKTVEEAEKLQDKLRKAMEQLEQDKSKLRES